MNGRGLAAERRRRARVLDGDDRVASHPVSRPNSAVTTTRQAPGWSIGRVATYETTLMPGGWTAMAVTVGTERLAGHGGQLHGRPEVRVGQADAVHGQREDDGPWGP